MFAKAKQYLLMNQLKQPLLSLGSERWRIRLAFFCIYFIWGSTYLATDWALQAFPPFLMTGVRLLVAGALLLAVSYPAFAKTSAQQLKNSVLQGILILGLGTGGTMWSINYLDSGIASLIVGCEPLILVFFVWYFLEQRPSWQKLFGVALGILGMYILFSQQSFTTQPDAYKGVAAIGIAMVGWSLGTIHIKKNEVPASKVFHTTLQMLSSGVFLILVGFLVQEDLTTIPERFTWLALGSFLYLMFFGSIIAYSAFNYLLIKEDPSKVATATYINPIIALFLGWSLNDEFISGQALLAATVLIFGVVFIIRSR